MIRHLVSFAAFVAMLAVVSPTSIAGANGTINGIVKITSQASSAGAVVFVQQAPGTFTPPKPADMDQRKLAFVPHVLPIVVGTTVKFLNSDALQHNVFSPDNEKYNLGTWPQGQTKDYTFSKCGKAPCVYTQLCRVHTEMEGFVVVLQNPYFALTDAEGKYQIANVAPGAYTLAVWHPKAKTQSKPVTVDGAKPATVDFTLSR